MVEACCVYGNGGGIIDAIDFLVTGSLVVIYVVVVELLLPISLILNKKSVPLL